MSAMCCIAPSPSGGGQGWGQAAFEPATLLRRPLAPIPAFPQRGKEQDRRRAA